MVDVSGRESLELGVRGSLVQIQSPRPINIGVNCTARLTLFSCLAGLCQRCANLLKRQRLGDDAIGTAHMLKVEALERGRISFCLVDRTRSYPRVREDLAQTCTGSYIAHQAEPTHGMDPSRQSEPIRH